MKRIVATALAIVFLLPFAAMTAQSAATSEGAAGAALSSQLDNAASAAGALPAEGWITDEELVEVSGRNYYGSLPWQGLVPEMETVTRIKLWDEADRVQSQLGVLKAPGSICTGSMPLLATKP